jgi:hypothetical protein
MKIWTIGFALSRPSNVEAHAADGDIRFSLEIGGTALRVENIEADSEGSARGRVEQFANAFLNTLASSQNEALEIVPSSWTSETSDEPGIKSVGGHLEAAASLRASVRVAKIDANGYVVEVRDSDRLGEIEIRNSDAAAYYRKALLASDSFDRFRNYYLVVENVADRIRLKGPKSKLQEEPLLSQALTQCFSANPNSLLQAAQNVSGFSQTSGVFGDVASLLYKAYRCQLNHAKAMESKRIPFNSADEKAVADALPLMAFVAKSLIDYENEHL